MEHKIKSQAEKNIDWAFSILSDAQEEIARGNGNCAHNKINDAKRVLMGSYTEHDNGFSISIIRGRIKPLPEEQEQS